MRIISGTLGGRKVEAPEGKETRPTTDRVREALFSTLQSLKSLSHAHVVDLYAGSGALAYEAISRGAMHAVLVEKSPRAMKVIKENAKQLGIEKQVSFIQQDTEKSFSDILRMLSVSGASTADIVFADPPYGENPGQRLIVALKKCELVKSGSILVLESDSDFDLGDAQKLEDALFEVVKTKKYGDTSLHFIRYL